MTAIPLLPPRALVWLVSAFIRSSFRSVWRRKFSLSGTYFVLILVSLIALFSVDKAQFSPLLKTLFNLFGPMLVSVFTLFGIRTGLSVNPFSFSAPETTFLIASPFSRRDLLLYKIFQFNLLALGGSLIAGICVAPSHLPTAVLKFYLVLFFVQGVPVATAVLVGGANNLFVRLLRLSVDLLLGLIIVSLIATIYFSFVGQEKIQIFSQKIFYELTTPFLFIDAYVRAALTWRDWRLFAPFVIPDLLFAAIFLVGYRRLEIESVFYKNLHEGKGHVQRLRGLGARPISWGALPLRWFPDWGGFGPILWRKSQEYVRNVWSVVLVSSFTGLAFSGVLIFLLRLFEPGSEWGLMLWHVHCASQTFVLILAVFSGFSDFRNDMSLIPLMKTWPIGPMRMVTAQIFLSMINLGWLMALMMLIGSKLYMSYAAFPVPIFTIWSLCTIPFSVFLVASFDNLLFLLLPVPETKLSGKTAGRIIVQFVALVIGNGLLARVFFLIDQQAAAWARANQMSHAVYFATTSAAFGALGLVFFAGAVWAFRRYDISRV